jgi:hypothetical protein
MNDSTANDNLNPNIDDTDDIPYAVVVGFEADIQQVVGILATSEEQAKERFLEIQNDIFEESKVRNLKIISTSPMEEFLAQAEVMQENIDNPKRLN